MIKTGVFDYLRTIATFTSSQVHHDNPNIRSTLFLSVLILVLSILFSIKWIIKKKNPNQQLPLGSRALTILGNLPFLDPELHTYFTDLSQIFGPIFKIQLGNKLGIIISLPSLAKEVLKDHDTTFANRDVPVAGRAITYGVFGMRE
ncbi:hypothetical protein MKW98_010958 [Papaver atlanticum]|uniref:Cytochrome P450 n=1 Tax=Papaver atlanticum TaxID=357466 RepID=A0AAD4TL69_9MAGN|nr:hypothetical protein MKW98_010958 [Papaver atlanticum]